MKIGLISENLKVAWWMKRFCIILNIKQNLNFPAKNWESGFGFGSCKEKTEFLTSKHWHSWLQILKNWEGQENKIQNLLYVENYKDVFKTCMLPIQVLKTSLENYA